MLDADGIDAEVGTGLCSQLTVLVPVPTNIEKLSNFFALHKILNYLTYFKKNIKK